MSTNNHNHNYSLTGTAYTQEQHNTMRTAFLTAFPKIFTDIPFATEIFSQAIRFAHESGFRFQPEQFVAKLAIELEARHKAINSAIRKHVAKYRNNVVILELGAGLSSRRLEFSNLPYIEIDFMPVIELKRKIYKMLGYSCDNDEFLGVDMANVDDLVKITHRVGQFNETRSILVVSEGLFWYLTRSTVQTLAKSIHNILSSSNGIWIAGDCPSEFLQPKEEEYRTVIAKSSDRRMDEPFATLADYIDFFESEQYTVIQTKMEQWLDPMTIVSANIFSPSLKLTLDKLRTYTDIAEFSVTH